jgi:hypothetical protein
MPDFDLIRQSETGVMRWVRVVRLKGRATLATGAAVADGPEFFQPKCKFCCRFAVFAAARKEGLNFD